MTSVGPSGKSPLLRVEYLDPQEGWRGILVVDSLVDGKAAGGIRMMPEVDVIQVAELARRMTLKTRALGLSLGGLKWGIARDPMLEGRKDAIRRFLGWMLPFLRQSFGFGADLNTNNRELDEIALSLGLTSRHAGLSADPSHDALYRALLAKPIGPLTFDDARVGIGVAEATEVTAAGMGLPRRLRVAIQGFGAVGGATAYWLRQRGHELVAVADQQACYVTKKTFDVEALLRARAGGVIRPQHAETQRLPREAILGCDCDVLVLAAQSGALALSDAPGVAAKLVVEGANAAVTPDAETSLRKRGVLVAPDFLANGGAVAMVAGIFRMGWTGDDPVRHLDNIGALVQKAVQEHLPKALEQRQTIRHVATEQLGVAPTVSL